jgi:hypothetical protein
MKRRTGSPRIYLASSGNDKMPVVNSEERLLSLLETLEECRAFLMDKANSETARLLSLAILELRMELHQVTDSELKALCDLMVPEDQPSQDTDVKRTDAKRTDAKRTDANHTDANYTGAKQALQLPPYLKLIK